MPIDYKRLISSFKATRTVPLKEWGGDVVVKRLSPKQKLHFVNAIADDDGSIDTLDRDKLFAPAIAAISQSVIDEDGSCPFDNDEGREALEHLLIGSPDFVTLLGAVLDINNMGGAAGDGDDEEAAKKK